MPKENINKEDLVIKNFDESINNAKGKDFAQLRNKLIARSHLTTVLSSNRDEMNEIKEETENFKNT